MKQTLILIITFCWLSNLSLAQNERDNYVDMNPDELKSLISKLVLAKRQNMTYQQYWMYRQIQMHKKIISSKRKGNSNIVATTPSSHNNDAQLNKIENMLLKQQVEQQSTNSKTSDVSRKDLNKMKSDILSEIEVLKKEVNKIPEKSEPEPIIVKVPKNSNDDVEFYEQLAKNMNEMNQSINAIQKKLAQSNTSKSDNSQLEKEVVELSKSIRQLQLKVDVVKGNAVTDKFAQELKDIKNMIGNINQLKSTHTKETIRTNTISNNTNTKLEYLDAAIKGQEISQILFTNASHALTEDAKNTIRNIANLLKKHDRLDVLIAGYTSAQGSLLYNQELSLQRTESVKRFLMELGVHATHIFSEYHGIDYNATDDSNARRVELKILVRK